MDWCQCAQWPDHCCRDDSDCKLDYSISHSMHQTNPFILKLLKQKALSPYTGTRSKVTDFVFLIIATGILTGELWHTFIHHIALFVCCTSPLVAVNTIALALYATMLYIPTSISTAIMIFTPTLYANSILAMFNTRMAIGDSRNASFNTGSATVVSTFAAADAGK